MKTIADRLYSHIFNIEEITQCYEASDFELIRTANLETFYKNITRSLVFRLTSFCATQKLNNEIEVVFDQKYATLWDHFKAVALPTFTKWFHWKINYIVQRKKVTFERKAFFPDLTVSEEGKKFGRMVVHEFIGLEDL